MRRNRRGTSALTVIVAVLVGLGLIAPSAGLTAAMLALPMFAAMTAFAALTGQYANPTRRQTAWATRVAARAAGATAIAASAVGGLADLLGDATAPVLVTVVLIATPWVWSTTRPRIERLIVRLTERSRASTDSDPGRHRGQAA